MEHPERPDYPRDPYQPKREWHAVKILGVLLAAAVAVGGLYLLGFFVLLVVGLNNFGSNK